MISLTREARRAVAEPPAVVARPERSMAAPVTAETLAAPSAFDAGASNHAVAVSPDLWLGRRAMYERSPRSNNAIPVVPGARV